jgi:class 3 adenylate cyclase
MLIGSIACACGRHLTLRDGDPRRGAGAQHRGACLHTGECKVRGDDIGGIGVHIGARVSALAGANEVLVSSTLGDLVIGSGLEFEERGAHELRGVPGEWRLFAVASA